MESRDPVAVGSVETRKRIMFAAEAMFGEKGYAATTMRDITAAANCNVAAINYHFGSKRLLYREAMQNLMADMRDTFVERIMEPTRSADDLESYLAKIVAAAFEVFHETPRGRCLLALMDRESHGAGSRRVDILDEFARPVEAAALDRLKTLVPLADDRSARLCLDSLWGQLLFMVRARVLARGAGATPLAVIDEPALTSHVVRFTAAGIRTCLARSTPKGQP